MSAYYETIIKSPGDRDDQVRFWSEVRYTHWNSTFRLLPIQDITGKLVWGRCLKRYVVGYRFQHAGLNAHLVPFYKSRQYAKSKKELFKIKLSQPNLIGKNTSDT